jgi:hypothetical protein
MDRADSSLSAFDQVIWAADLSSAITVQHEIRERASGSLGFCFSPAGFVWSAVYAMLIPRKLDTEQIRFMEFFTLSSINNAFWSWLIYLSYVKKIYVDHQIVEALLLF